MDEGTDDTALTELRRACATAAEAIRGMTDPRAAIDAAGRLAAAVKHAGSQAAQVRAESVRRLWETEHMSLAELARQIGVSKARANQLIHAASGTSESDHAGQVPGRSLPVRTVPVAHTAERKPEVPSADRSDAAPQEGCAGASHLARRKQGRP